MGLRVCAVAVVVLALAGSLVVAKPQVTRNGDDLLFTADTLTLDADHDVKLSASAGKIQLTDANTFFDVDVVATQLAELESNQIILRNIVAALQLAADKLPAAQQMAEDVIDSFNMHTANTTASLQDASAMINQTSGYLQGNLTQVQSEISGAVNTTTADLTDIADALANATAKLNDDATYAFTDNITSAFAGASAVNDNTMNTINTANQSLTQVMSASYNWFEEELSRISPASTACKADVDTATAAAVNSSTAIIQALQSTLAIAPIASNVVGANRAMFANMDADLRELVVNSVPPLNMLLTQFRTVVRQYLSPATISQFYPTTVESTTLYGAAVSCSSEWMAVGAYGEGSSGAVYVYAAGFVGIDNSSVQHLVYPATDTNSYYGFDVAIEDDLLVIGAPYSDLGRTSSGASLSSSGAVFVYTLQGGQWNLSQTLTYSDPSTSDFLGYSVAIGDDYIVASAPLAENTSSSAGGVIIFQRGSSGAFTETHAFFPGDVSDFLGYGPDAVAAHGDWIAAGARNAEDSSNGGGSAHGEVFMFYRKTGKWTFFGRIAPTRTSYDYFGHALALSRRADGTIVMAAGAYGDDTSSSGSYVSSSGAVYFFEIAPGSTTIRQTAVARPSVSQSGAYFGRSLSLSKDATTAVIGADMFDVSGSTSYSNAGSAYLFSYSSTGWTELKQIFATSPSSSGYFGRTVGYGEAYYVVSEPYNDDVAFNAGSVELTQAPVLAPTGEEVLQREVVVEAPEQLASATLEERFEIERCAAAIRAEPFHRVALQFPDHLLSFAGRVYDALRERTEASLFLLGDTSFGECCVDEVAAEHAGADLIIHFGHSCLSRTTKIPALYAFGRCPVNVGVAQQIIAKTVDKQLNLLLLTAVEYAHAADAAAAAATCGSCSTMPKASAHDTDSTTEEALTLVDEPEESEEIDDPSREPAPIPAAVSARSAIETEQKRLQFGLLPAPHVLHPCYNVLCFLTLACLNCTAPDVPFLRSFLMLYNQQRVFNFDPTTNACTEQFLRTNKALMRRYDCNMSASCYSPPSFIKADDKASQTSPARALAISWCKRPKKLRRWASSVGLWA
ncbi:uncharacterized protein MONBRDRAFT_33491 [Monosiga brevicollis MX1]|uniref:Diphthamide biosynthesis protein 2 n=1 Tax=Monosiga brevicollis TaxID=81824 RepID=A9V5N7_MONBE|nr:uncharacterized protein MONBRDRAFT_33491 [Monosiga brevicollis MX1]EDQ87073.1 predicted protein [Monosiga brevicollis MX1]|eukprot:XP_001748016.1 hypothetical protein [Monosiga brevicollis MX1]